MLAREALLLGDARPRDRDRGRERHGVPLRPGHARRLRSLEHRPALRRVACRAGAARLRRGRCARRARGQGSRLRRRDDRDGRLQAGVVQGSRRERAHAPPEVRRHEQGRSARALPLAAPSGHVHGGVALHRPPRLRPRLLRRRRKRPCPRDSPSARGHARDRSGRDGDGDRAAGSRSTSCPTA